MKVSDMKVNIYNLLSEEEYLWAESMHRTMLSFNEYRCPFSLLEEFDKWFTWHKRLHFEGQKTGKIITDMVNDLNEIRRHAIPREIKLSCVLTLLL